jgi:hypothetical protein
LDGEKASATRRLPACLREEDAAEGCEPAARPSTVRCEAGVEMAALTLTVGTEPEPSNDARGVTWPEPDGKAMPKGGSCDDDATGGG